MTVFYTNGDNATLARERQAKYRRRQKLSMALLHAAEARGISGYEAIAALQHIDFPSLRECAARGIVPAPDFNPTTLEFNEDDEWHTSTLRTGETLSTRSTA